MMDSLLVLLLIGLPASTALVIPLMEKRKRMARLTALVILIAISFLTIAILASLGAIEKTGSFYALTGISVAIIFYATISELLAVYGSEVTLSWPTGAAFQSLALIMLTGVYVTALSKDLLTLISGWILTSIASYAMTALAKDNPSAEGAAKYAIMGSASSTLLFLGVAVTFASLRGLDMGSQIAAPLPTLLLISILFIAATGFKMGVFPFHGWLPDTYGITYPAIISAISLVAKALAVIVLFKVSSLLVQSLGVNWLYLIALFSILTMLYGNLGALLQNNTQRLLAFSSIAHAGYLLIGFASLAPVAGSIPAWGLAGLITQYAAYSLAKVGSFLTLSIVKEVKGSTELETLKGLGREDPVLAGAFTVLLLSLMGMPPLLGFWGKLYLFASVAFSAPWLTAIALLNTAISVAYYARIIKTMYFESGRIEMHSAKADLKAARRAVIVTAALSVLLGLGPAHVLAMYSIK